MNRQPLYRLLLVVIVALFVCLVSGFLLLVSKPDLIASAASSLRHIVGNHAVARLETAAFLLQDRALRQGNELGLIEANAPWQTESTDESSTLKVAPLVPVSTATSTPTIEAEQPSGSAPPTLVATANILPTPIVLPTAQPLPTQPLPTLVANPWNLDAIPPFGNLEGEGQWQPYIYHSDGSVVGQRTFLQPDPERPHTIVAVVAFDLNSTNLHYVLGSEEPSLADGPRGYGLIDPTDKQPGKLLAAFNSGFLATHGEYGAMSGGIVALPPKFRSGTVTIGRDGQVQIGVWGADVDPAGDYVSLRQNASIVVHEGNINDKVFNGSIASWGGNLDGVIVTWRSGLGLSADGQVLYYLAGPAMSMPILAKTMIATGIHNGILLDINPYWVHFSAVRSEGDQLLAETLFEEGMETQPDRYLRQSQRDFFYLTSSTQ